LTSSANFVSKPDTILRELLDVMSARRTTIHMDVPNMGFHVDDVVTEAFPPCALSLKEVAPMDQRQVSMVEWIERERRVLVQKDFANANPVPSPALTEIYGEKSQMLDPIIWKDHMIGRVSVYYTEGPREWRGKDIESLDKAVSLVRWELRTIDPGTRNSVGEPP
jgi:hypothetical protein